MCCSPSIVIFTLGLLAWVFSVIALTTCVFIQNTERSDYYDLSYGFGLFAFDLQGECRVYANNRAAGTHSLAQGFAISTFVTIAAAVACNLLSMLRRPIWHLWSATFFGTASFFSLLTLVLLYTAPYKQRVCLERGDCRPSLGAWLTMVDIVLLLGLALYSATAKTSPGRDVEGAGVETDDNSTESRDRSHDDVGSTNAMSLFSSGPLYSIEEEPAVDGALDVASSIDDDESNTGANWCNFCFFP